MKNIGIKSSHLSHEEAKRYVNEIFGNDVEVDFDENCISNIKLTFLDGNVISLAVEYNKMAVKISSDKTVYWPIANKLVDRTFEYVKELLNKKL